MKLNWTMILGLGLDLFKIIKRIFLEEKSDNNGITKLANVRTFVRDLLKRRGWWRGAGDNGAFSDSDIDKVVNGVVWFIKKVYQLSRR